ncbi:alpha/beta fold hydrolase [Nocardioides deserti]|uniref:Alpha/beta hydrolase n=1 Tax=Nocardioides deserti TaxID=1588644 RepID=A0ABR6UBA0_9ACTN|nr:alpha/beta hydrolase [Nocardioides deserti]MBC2961725.1 alpha/beta hydrolase [Nocardioides deserti]GGO73073.1 hypothetical protein GCM10012276_17790 [Nocardioides deserti]
MSGGDVALVRRARVRTPRADLHVRWVQGPDATCAWVLLHQSPLSSRRFEPLLPELGRWSDAYAPDTPGYGDSLAVDGDWRVPDHADALWGGIDQLTDLPVYLLGRATGTVMAVEMARARPERVRHLVLHGLPVYTEGEKADRLAGFAPPYVPSADGSHLDWIWRRIRGEYPWAPPEMVTSMVADYLAAGPDFACAYRAIWRYDLHAALGEVERSGLPTTLLAGGRDRIGYMHERAVAALPWAASRVLPEATDFVAEQNPRDFAGLLREVVARDAPGR